QREKAPVARFFFPEKKTPLFKIASHISLTLRLSLFFKEVYDKIGSEIQVRIGEVIPCQGLEAFDRKDLMEHLRKATYELGASLPHKKIRGRRPSASRKPRKSS